MLSKTLMLYVFITITLKDTSCFPSRDFVDSNSLPFSSTSEESQETPIVSVKLFPPSSESTYEVTPLCKTKIKSINPNDLARARGYSVSDDPNFSQTIEVEECDEAGSACSFFVLNMKSACKQKYMSIKLKVLTDDLEEKMESFDIPSICECALFPKKSRSLKL